jgi:hypothetical protein
MFARSPFGDKPFAGSDDGDGPVTLTGRGIVSGVATTSLEDTLAEQARGLVFTAEIHPWVLSSRS